MDDVIWALSVAEMALRQPTHRKHSREEYRKVAEQLTAMRRDWPHSPNSYEAIFLTELRGLLQANEATLSDVVDSATREAKLDGEIGVAQSGDAGQLLLNFVLNSNRLNRLATELPQLHILASLYSVVRLDQNRPYRATDFEDFRHAASALPYSDMFVTEKHLSHLLRSSPLNLDRRYATAVASSLDEAIDTLKQW
jgi:hypothetical protein